MLGGVTFTSNGKQVPEQTQHVSSRQGEGSGLCKSLAPTGMASRDRDKQQPSHRVTAPALPTPAVRAGRGGRTALLPVTVMSLSAKVKHLQLSMQVFVQKLSTK